MLLSLQSREAEEKRTKVICVSFPKSSYDGKLRRKKWSSNVSQVVRKMVKSTRVHALKSTVVSKAPRLSRDSFILSTNVFGMFHASTLSLLSLIKSVLTLRYKIASHTVGVQIDGPWKDTGGEREWQKEPFSPNRIAFRNMEEKFRISGYARWQAMSFSD